MPSLRQVQQRWRYRRIRRAMYSMRRGYNTPARYRAKWSGMMRRYPVWYFKYGRYKRLRY